LYARKIARVSRHDEVALIFNSAGLATISHAQIALPRIGRERHEDDLGALIDKVASELWEFSVVADEHADGATVGVDNRKLIASFDVPPISLTWSGMDLCLLVD